MKSSMWFGPKIPLARSVTRALAMVAIVCVVAAADSDLPEGKGKDVVEDTCTDCHSLHRIKIQRLDEQGWNNILHEMIENGAAIEPDDMKTIVEYLAKNFGPDKKVNVNKADADEIGMVLQLTPAEAKAIVQYRKENGSFKDLATVESASGATDKVEAKKALIEF